MNKGMNVLITGAHGFIGRHTARCFAGHGYVVTGMGHGSWTQDEWRSWGLTDWYETDVTGEALRALPKRPDVIVHCAGSGSVSFSMNHPRDDFHRSVSTTVDVVDYVRDCAPDTRVVYPSSASVYGAATSIPIREDSPSAPISPYGSHKWIAEQIVQSYSRHYALRASIVRLFSVYGCGLRKQLLWDACRKFASGDGVFMGTGAEVRDWLYIDDAAELLFAAAKYASVECRVANGGTGIGVSVSEMLTHLSNCLSRSGGQIRFSERPRGGDPSVYVADISHAKQWKWEPSAQWRDRVAEYVAWWRLEMGISQN